ncbi:MAG: hypothetical protein GF331_08970 [Chitinivibrionales bacterium]|nr:hypothetical protein [Chitinivibrionales bacterium]
MEIVFAVFQDYADATGGVTHLMSSGFTREKINVLARKGTLTTTTEPKHVAGGVEQVAKEQPEGPGNVEMLFPTETPVVLGPDGPVLGSGDMASSLLTSALAGGHDTIERMLGQFLEPAHASAYADALRDGMVLVWVVPGPQAEPGAVSDLERELRDKAAQMVTTIDIRTELHV